MIVILSGLSCAGKDTAQNYLVTKGFKNIISTTSRPIRPKEKEGVEYHFVTKEEFKNKINNNEFLEHREYHTLLHGVPDVWYYGIELKNIPEDNNVVAVLDPIGYYALLDKFGKENVKLIWLELDEETRKERNILRGDYDESEFTRRNIKDIETFAGLEDEANIMINNCGSLEDLHNYLDLAIEELEALSESRIY